MWRRSGPFRVPGSSECLFISSASPRRLAHLRLSPTRAWLCGLSGRFAVASVGRGESPGDRTVSAGGRANRRREPGRVSVWLNGQRPARVHLVPGRATGGKSGRHGVALDPPSRSPQHGHSYQAAGELCLSARTSTSTGMFFVCCSNGSLPGRPIRGPQFPSFVMVLNEVLPGRAQAPSGICLRSKQDIVNGCACWSSRFACQLRRTSSGNRPIAGRYAVAARHDRVIFPCGIASCCASLNVAVGASAAN